MGNRTLFLVTLHLNLIVLILELVLREREREREREKKKNCLVDKTVSQIIVSAVLAGCQLACLSVIVWCCLLICQSDLNF